MTSADTEAPPVRLIKELKYLEVLDVSPDGSKLCAYATRNPTRSFVWNGGWREKNQVRDGEDALRIIDPISWNMTFATRLPAMPYPPTGFFAEGKALYVEIPGVRGGGTLHLTINLQTGEQRQLFVPYQADALLYFSYRALSGPFLIGQGINPKNAHSEVLVKVEAPSYRELDRVPYAGVRSPSTGRTEAPMAVSADRGTFLCSYDNTVVCRRSADLQTKWTQKIDEERMLWRLALTPDGSLAAASASNHVSVLSGKDGKELIRMPVKKPMEGLAISPDGKLLAVGYRIALPPKRFGTQPTVLLFDIASGKKLATLIHDQFPDGGREFLYAGVNVFFLPDNKHLITSGLNTKIWEIRRL